MIYLQLFWEYFKTGLFAVGGGNLFIVLGSSLTVTPANQFPLIAKENGAKLVIINQDLTSFDHFADLVINNRKIGEVLQELDQLLK